MVYGNDSSNREILDFLRRIQSDIDQKFREQSNEINKIQKTLGDIEKDIQSIGPKPKGIFG